MKPDREARIAWPSRLAFNQFTATPRPMEEWLAAALRAGVPAIGLNREQVEELGFERAQRLLQEAGIPITIYSSVGYWAGAVEPNGRTRTATDNLRNLDQAVALSADVVGVIPGGLAPGDKDLRDARERVFRGLAELIPPAVDRGLRLAIEPLHPIFGPTRSIVHTLRETLDMIERLGAPDDLGVVVDTYHIWWEPGLLRELRRARGRVFLVQINDWSPEMARTSDPVLNRALPGEGCIDLDLFLEGLSDYTGLFELEVPNEELRALSADDMFARLLETYQNSFAARLHA